MDKEIVKELIQSELNSVNLKLELDRILHGESRQKMLSDYNELIVKLGGSGASAKAASLMVNYLKN